MKSDHMFRELSVSDDHSSKSWSLNSDGENAFDESVHGGGYSKECWKNVVGMADEDDMAKADDVGHD
ncbi:hypothetical protein SLA2020_000370 [Shorea laevis]